jgi:acetyl esterase
MPPDRLSALARARSSVERIGFRAILGVPWICRRLAASRVAPVEGRTLDREFAVMLGLDDLAHHSDLRALTPVQARKRVAADMSVVDAPPVPGVEHVDMEIPGPAGLLGARLYTPQGLAGPSPAVVYIHGGGWVTGSIATHDSLCRRVAVGGRCRVVSIEYRLAPEHRYPAAADDASAATRWILAHAEELGVDPGRVAVAGDSAGGNLSAVVARRTRGDARRPALQVLLYPALDGTFSLPSHQSLAEGYFLTGPMCEWYYAHYAGDADRREPDISPLLAPDVSDVPALIYTSGFDPLRDEGAAYAERLQRAGTRVVYRELAHFPHGFACMTGAATAARLATDEIAKEIGDDLRSVAPR